MTEPIKTKCKCGGEMHWNAVRPGRYEPAEDTYYKGTCIHCDNVALSQDEPKGNEDGK